MSFASFVSELKRRRVFRVVVVYVVAGWAAMQFADLVLPRLGVPDWTVTLVIVLAIAGLPIAAGLAWAFDVTGDGIRRTPDKEQQPEPLPIRPHRALWFVAGIVVALMIGWFAVKQPDNPGGALDDQLIAVLPFRVAGADASLKYLREGMLDLMAATLVADDGTRAIDPPTVITRWKQAVASQDDDLPVDSARAVARALRAGHLLIGSIIGTPQSITMNVELVDVAKGGVRRIRATGHADSLPQLVDRVAGQVLSFTAGEAGDRASLLSGVPLPAIRAYLAGRKEYRGGNYGEAGRHFGEALRVDSTFLLAALSLRLTAGWVNVDDEAFEKAQRIAWAGKEQLSQVDRAQLIAIMGPRFPKPSSGAEHLAAAYDLLRIAPDRAEAHNWVGEWLYHRGEALGIENAQAEAIEAFTRMLELDPDNAGPAEHIAELALRKGDTATVRRMADRVLARDTLGVTATQMRFLRAAAQSDENAKRRVRESVANMDVEELFGVIYHAQASGFGLDIAEPAVNRILGLDSGRRWHVTYHFELNRGRPGRAREIALKAATANAAASRDADLRSVGAALFSSGDTAVSAQAAQRLASAIRGSELRNSQKALPICMVTQWRMAGGDFSRAREAVTSLRTIARDTAPAYSAELCADLIEAQLAVAERRPDADARLARVDNVAATAPAGLSPNVLHFINMSLAVGFQRRGNDRAALAALRRRAFYLGTAHEYLGANLLMSARLASKLGERDDAVSDYTHYLKLMESPEPSFRPQVDAARRELQQLSRD